MSRTNDSTELATLSRQSHASLRALGLPATFTLAALHERMEAYRSRRVHLIPRELPVLAPHGVWIATDLADYVFYDTTGGAVREHQIIAHEFGHMLFDDAATTAELEELVALLMPTIEPAVAGNLLARTTYGPPRERRAEVFATVVVQRVEAWSTLPKQRTSDPAVLRRMIATLEGGCRT